MRLVRDRLNLSDIADMIGDAIASVTKFSLGLGNVDDTSDMNKPVSAAAQSALDGKADIVDLSAVAFSGDYSHLSGVPVLGDLAVLDTVTVSDVAASGTAGSTTFLRGDGVWAVPPTGGGGGSVDSVNGHAGTVVLDADDIDDTATVNRFVTGSDLTTLANTSGVNTGDQDLSGYAVLSALGSAAYEDVSDFASASHNHDAAYAALGHNHDAAYAAVSHNHDVAYATIWHGHAQSDVTGLSASLSARPVLGVGSTSTATGTAAKVVTGDTPVPGSLYLVTFTAGQTATTLSLNVNGIGAVNVLFRNATATAAAGTTAANGVILFYYSGAAFHIVSSNWNTDTNTTYSEILDTEITAGTATTLRSISGRRAQSIVVKAQTTVPAPTNGPDAANKTYVDSGLSGKASSTHDHDPNSVVAGVRPWLNSHVVSTATVPRSGPGTEHWSMGGTLNTTSWLTRLGAVTISSGGINWGQFHSHTRGIVWVNLDHVTTV